MSDAVTTIADTLSAAQVEAVRKKAKPATRKAGSNLPGANRAKAPAAPAQVRTPITFESAARLCPTSGQIAKIVVAYGLDAVDFNDIRDQTQAAFNGMSESVAPFMNAKALEMHLQRIAGALVGSAHGAGSFYDTKAQQARNATIPMMNEDRDEDRMGVDNQANRAERSREFAATAAVQAYAALAAARGALDAYTEITGETWKPYVGNAQPGRTVDARAAAAQLAAFERE